MALHEVICPQMYAVYMISSIGVWFNTYPADKFCVSQVANVFFYANACLIRSAGNQTNWIISLIYSLHKTEIKHWGEGVYLAVSALKSDWFIIKTLVLLALNQKPAYMTYSKVVNTSWPTFISVSQRIMKMKSQHQLSLGYWPLWPGSTDVTNKPSIWTR